MLIRKKALTIVCLLALKVLFTTVDEKKRFVVDLVDADENNIWQHSTFEEQGVEAELYHVDTAAWLAAEFGNPKYADGFTLRAAVRKVDGQRAWSCPADTDAWLGHQAAVDVIANGAVVAALQLYSDKSLLSNKGTWVYPLKAVLLNAPFAARTDIRNMRNIAFFPELQRPQGMPLEQFKEAKRAIHHRVLLTTLAPLKQLSQSGEALADPSGVKRWVLPRLLNYVGDDPECKTAAGVYVSGQGKKPCEMCYCPLQQMNQVLDDYPPRTVAEQLQIMGRIEQEGQKSKAAAQRESAEWSTHFIREHGLFGFAGQHLVWGNPFLCFGYDSLHVDQLGLWPDLVKCIKPFCDTVGVETNLGRSCGSAVLARMNDNLPEMPR